MYTTHEHNQFDQKNRMFILRAFLLSLVDAENTNKDLTTLHVVLNPPPVAKYKIM